MSDVVSEQTGLQELRQGFRGELIGPEHPGYDDRRRIFNAMMNRRPVLIARCTGTADVIAVLAYARERELPIAVRGGGHSVAGYSTCDDGIVIDMSPMKGVRVDPASRTARGQAGLTWGEFDRETQAFGLATVGGRVTTTGIAGLTLGSGTGWSDRKHGYTGDNLLSADVVTADGELVVASDRQNEDLFWGLRGGGGNFGIVTEFEYRLHPMGPILLGGLVLHPREKAPEVARFYRDFMAEAPDGVGSALAFITAPPAPFVSPELQGRPAVGIVAAYFGPVDEGERALEPLRRFANPPVDVLQPLPYVVLQTLIDEANAPGRRNYWKTENMAALSDAALDTLVERAAGVTSPLTQLLLVPLGGAIGKVGEDDTALSGRSALWQYHCYTIWEGGDDDLHVAWTRETAKAMAPYTIPGVSPNFTSEVDGDRLKTTFGEEKYRRLQALKDKYDPANVFRINQNIKPSSDA